MHFYDEMNLTPQIKQALDWGLFRMYILGPALYYGVYRLLMRLANRTIAKYSGKDSNRV